MASGQRNGSRNQTATVTRQLYVSSLAWQRKVFLENLLKTDDIPRSLSDVEDHFELSQSSAGGLHQSAGVRNLQVYELDNRRIRNHILRQGSGSENNIASLRTSTNIPSEGDDY